jgi:hypothetical protein
MMKKAVFGLGAALAALIVLAGCGSAPAPAPAPAPVSETAKADRPDWVLNPPQDDEKIFGLGSAISTNESRGWRMAENRARSSISYQITAIVEGMQVDYTQQAGNDNAEIGENFFEDVGRQVTATVLNGARVEKRGISSNGTYYVLVSYSEAAVRESGSAAIQTAANKAQADAAKALRSLDTVLAAKRTPILVETGGEE